MALPNLKAAALGAFASLAAVAPAYAQETTPVHAIANDCDPLIEINGLTADAGLSAQTISSQTPGLVAISAYPGPDLHDYPTFLEGLFEKNGVRATCFINSTEYETSGSALSFYVAGTPVSFDGRQHFGIDEINSNIEILKTVAAEARTAQLLLASNNADSNLALNSN